MLSHSPGSLFLSTLVSSAPAVAPARQRAILRVLIFAQLLIWIDGTILTTTYETLADPVRGLGATPGELQWATGAYTLVFATLSFTGGALGDRFGHRNVLIGGMTLFGIASGWAAYAQTPAQLIVARCAMGVGAALLLPATMAVISWTFEPARRPAAFAMLSSFAGVGIAAGPILSGLLLSHFWWGSVFIVNIPVVVVGLVCIVGFVPNFRSPQVRRLDPAGLMLSMAGLALLAYGLIRAGQDASVDSPLVWVSLAAGAAVIGVFILVELRIAHPSFDPRLLAQRQFGSGNVALMLIFLALTSSSFYLAFYLQGPRHFSALQAGCLGLPGALMVVVAAPIGTRLIRRSSVRLVASVALAVASVDMAAFAFFGARTSLAWYEVFVVVQGLSIGMAIPVLSGMVLGSLPVERAGAGGAVNSTLRQTGSVLGIAVGGTIASLVYRRAIEPALAGTTESVRERALVSAESARHAAATSHDPGLAGAADSAFIHAAHVTSLWTAGFVVAALLVVGLGLRPGSKA